MEVENIISSYLGMQFNDFTFTNLINEIIQICTSKKPSSIEFEFGKFRVKTTNGSNSGFMINNDIVIVFAFSDQKSVLKFYDFNDETIKHSMIPGLNEIFNRVYNNWWLSEELIVYSCRFTESCYKIQSFAELMPRRLSVKSARN